MNQASYPVNRKHAARYTFTSEGERRIEKVAEFTHSTLTDIFNLAFGDLLPDGSIDDTATSNNGDIIKVLSTVVQILDDFTARHPHVSIFFSGSTAERTALYARIIKTYHSSFVTKFDIKAIIAFESGYRQIVFDPGEKAEYIAFVIKRKP